MSPLGSQTPSPAADPLAQLRDIHLPQESISQLPSAPGWWLLALMLGAAGVTTFIFWRRQQQRNRYRGQAQALLSQLIAGEQDAAQFIQSINTLTKRAARAAYPDIACSTYFGADWTRFLKHSAPKLAMPEAVEDYLINSSYRPPQVDSDAMHTQQLVLDYTLLWVQQHLSQRRLLRREANIGC